MPDDDMQPCAARQLARQIGQLPGAGLHEGGAQQQVFGRVAAQPELGRDDEVRALRMRAARCLGDAARVAGEVADGGIDLRQRHFHRGCR